MKNILGRTLDKKVLAIVILVFLSSCAIALLSREEHLVTVKMDRMVNCSVWYGNKAFVDTNSATLQ